MHRHTSARHRPSCVPMQALAEDGALILGERLRSADERQVVADVLARVMNAKVRAGEAHVRHCRVVHMEMRRCAPLEPRREHEPFGNLGV